VRKPGFLSTSTFRLALLYAILFGASVLALFSLVYWSADRALQRQTSQAIEAEIQALRERYRAAGLVGLVAAIEERVARPRLGDMLYLIARPDGTALAGNMTQWPRQVQLDGKWLLFPIERRWQTGEVAQSDARARSFQLPGDVLLLVGRDNRERDNLRALMVEALAWSVLAIVLLGVAGGLLLSRRLLGRIDAVARIAEEIRSGAVSARMPVTGSGDEFDRLSFTINRMLDEIERLVGSIRGVTVSIAHDLRSPLTRLRGRLEMAARSEAGDGHALRGAIEQAIEEADKLIGTFNALLSIAEAESGGSSAEMAEVDLAALVEDASDLYEPLAEERKLGLGTDAAAGIVVSGNRQLLFQALSNLLDNAIKYASPGSTVRVEARAGATGPELTVRDTGPGIPEADRQRVLEPFVRLDQSRGTPGSGLGLSLVQAIAHLHGAQLMLADNGPGLAVKLAFPSPAAAPVSRVLEDAVLPEPTAEPLSAA
jgi:signal transduction histidine kinase